MQSLRQHQKNIRNGHNRYFYSIHDETGRYIYICIYISTSTSASAVIMIIHGEGSQVLLSYKALHTEEGDDESTVACRE